LSRIIEFLEHYRLALQPGQTVDPLEIRRDRQRRLAADFPREALDEPLIASTGQDRNRRRRGLLIVEETEYQPDDSCPGAP
jgi:hypothetical protein